MDIAMMKKQVYRHMSEDLPMAMALAMNETTSWIDESLARGDFK